MKRVSSHSHTGPACNSLGAHGQIVPWTEFEQHKLVDYGVFNAGFKGVTLIEVERPYKEIRLCEVRRRALTTQFDSCLRSARRSSIVPEKTRVFGGEPRFFTSWNRIASWLRRMDGLRSAA